MINRHICLRRVYALKELKSLGYISSPEACAEGVLRLITEDELNGEAIMITKERSFIYDKTRENEIASLLQ